MSAPQGDAAQRSSTAGRQGDAAQRSSTAGHQGDAAQRSSTAGRQGDAAPRGLTHVDETGAARMVDVGDKEVTRRVATASGVLRTTAEVCAALRDGTVPKGDALATARIAGIMGAKRTPDLIPLCHPIPLAGVTVELEVGETEVRVEATARSADRTGVEMEALTAVSVAGLALHDMVKALDPAATMDGVRLERKEGGRSGVWTRPQDR